MSFKISKFLTLLALVQQISCWGTVGHRTVAYLAQAYLTQDASILVNSLLANDKHYDFSDAALFADEIKYKRPETKPWHYIDAMDTVPDGCSVDYERDCNSNGSPGCIVSAIINMTARFNDNELSKIAQKEALMFLVHFLGDIHQPLHNENKDRGGTRLPVCFDNRCALNLHGIWDTEIVDKRTGHNPHANVAEEKLVAARWARDLFELNKAKGRTLDEQCTDISKAEDCALNWSREANGWICKFVMNPEPSGDLGGAYYDEAAPIVDELIGKAGMRLGAWLNALTAARHSQETFVVQNQNAAAEL